jgi:hypothetical protein
MLGNSAIGLKDPASKPGMYLAVAHGCKTVSPTRFRK